MDIGEVRAELESLGEEDFVARHGRFFLVLTDPDALDSVAGFVDTQSRGGQEIASGPPLEGVDVLPIVARSKNAPRVTVGREGDVDLRLPHRNVSKLHAWFVVQGGLLSLADGRSKNGTWQNGAALAPGKLVPVDVGDTLRFGQVAATVWGVSDLIAAAKKR